MVTTSSADTLSFSTARRLVETTFRVPERLRGAEWAEGRLILNEKDTPEPGPLRLSRTPYLREPLDCFSDESVEEITCEMGTQLGKTLMQFACLGSYALRRKCYIPAEEWAGIVADKDDDPEALAARILPDVLRFFEKHKRLGVVHAVTIPPRSRRNLERVHPMELVAARVAAEVGCDWAPMFEPWDKCGRGRHAKHGEIAITPAAARYTGKVVWVLDDVYTTGRTMRSAVQALLALEVHAHGLAWVYIA